MNPEIWTLMLDEMPILDPREHAWIEQMAGRKLSNEDAQMLLRAAALDAAFNTWVDGKAAN